VRRPRPGPWRTVRLATAGRYCNQAGCWRIGVWYCVWLGYMLGYMRLKAAWSEGSEEFEPLVGPGSHGEGHCRVSWP
jgi:hypothetical protein